MTDVAPPPQELAEDRPQEYDEDYADDTHDEEDANQDGAAENQNAVLSDDAAFEPQQKSSSSADNATHNNNINATEDESHNHSRNNEANASATPDDTDAAKESATAEERAQENSDSHDQNATSASQGAPPATKQASSSPVAPRKPNNEAAPQVSPRRKDGHNNSSHRNGGPRMTAAAEKDTELHLLYLPPNERPAVVDEHDRHRERMEAIATSRSVSQSTTMSKATQGSTKSRRSSPRNVVDPLTQQIMLNHKKALERVMQPGPQKLPLVHITHCNRLGNTHGSKEEFVNLNSPHEPLTARDRRLQHNKYRSGRLNAAERVDDDNAKFVAALIRIKSVVPPTMQLLEQERERQSWMRQIERGPSKASPRGTPAASVVVGAEVDHVRELSWNNRVSNVIPRPPVISSATMEHSSRPKALWDDKLTQARELERRKLASLQQKGEEANTSEGQGGDAAKSPTANASGDGRKGQASKSRRPKPPSSSLVDCMGKIPPVNSGRHSGHSAAPAVVDASSEGRTRREEGADSEPEAAPVAPSGNGTAPDAEAEYSDDHHEVAAEDDDETVVTAEEPGNSGQGQSTASAQETEAQPVAANSEPQKTVEEVDDEQPLDAAALQADA